MRIGLNLLYLLPDVVGGTETYAAGLLQGLAATSDADEFLVFVNRESAAWPLPEAPNIQRVVCPVSAGSQGVRYAYEQGRFVQLLAKHRVDLVHSFGYVAPLRAPCPSVVTIHDLNYRAFGDRMPLARRLALAFFARQSALRASRVLTVSEFSRREILDAYALSPERVVVTHNAPREWNGLPGEGDAKLLAGLAEAGSPYIVAFSSTSPNKNIPRLLEAFARAREQYRLPHRLVLVGRSAAENGAEIPRDPDGAVRFTGYLSDSALHAVLAGAQLLAFPSLYEGFGLPVVEAMTLGVPVVCSDRASLPEVAGDAAVFFDPSSTEEMAHKLALVARDAALRAELIEKGYANAGRFSWQATARRTLQVYREVVAV
ncbi:glycosyltransferase family 1 protein [soil metagenome]|nr:glycosyltransferase family 4 protein [Gemmatimonadota bacterium]